MDARGDGPSPERRNALSCWRQVCRYGRRRLHLLRKGLEIVAETNFLAALSTEGPCFLKWGCQRLCVPPRLVFSCCCCRPAPKFRGERNSGLGIGRPVRELRDKSFSHSPRGSTGPSRGRQDNTCNRPKLRCPSGWGSTCCRCGASASVRYFSQLDVIELKNEVLLVDIVQWRQLLYLKV